MSTDYDVVVVGGGTAGSFAAIAAATTGAKTLVIEKQGYLGGILSLGMHMLGTLDHEGYWALGGLGRKLILDLVNEGFATPPITDSLFGAFNSQDAEVAKIFLLQMASDAGVEFLFHSTVIDAETEGDDVTSVLVANKAGTRTIRAKSFVDCSGDADLVALAGGDFVFGSGEVSAPPQPVSNIYKVSGVDIERVWDYLEAHPEEYRTPPGWSGETYSMEFIRNTPGIHFHAFENLISEARAAGEFTITRNAVGIYTYPWNNEVGINVTRVHGVDGTDPDEVSRAELETRLQVLESFRFLRKYVPGFENCWLSSVPFQVGIRESRHIVTDRTLTKEDVLSGRDFSDQVGRGAYPLDIHDVQPNSTVLGNEVDGGGISLIRIAKSYGIPRRSLVPNGLSNVSVGGRCIGADQEAAGSARGQAVCMVTGHAAGVIAAHSALRGQGALDVPIDVLQKTLVEQGAVLARNEKPQSN
ncbi:FAD-dependent oxidoreductase [Paramicrobacterium chengjingii]|uniref:FAD-dependent oxidoreductase n=1 Tax=Paramicrobacterium chengjingii TaxID=2769067 RepID=UPI0014209332|nr:FAD-dependent oxidoreductase [Microbacterium chengjingii]